MATEPSKQPTTGDSALSSLHDAWNVARNAMGIQPALESTNELLDAIRESVADRPEYIELEQNCVGIREVLSRRTSRNQDDHLSQSALGTIDELTMTTNEIKRHIAKQGKRRAISRVLRPKKRKDSIATWRLRLNQILCVLSAEFGSGEPITVSSPRHEIADPHTDTADAHCVTSGAETIALTAPHKNLGSCTAVPQVPTGFVNMHAAGHETRRDGAETGDGASNPGCSTHVSTPDESPRDAGETISDNCSHIEETRTTVEVQEVMPQRINEDVSDGYQVARESVPGESPPPPPRIFGRDELVKEVVNLVDVNDPTPITLIGTGGIGKTSVALAALHDDRIKQRFGDHRRLLRCDQFAPSLPNFLRRLSEVIGAGIANPMDLAPLRPFLSRRKMLLLIDNAESLIGGPNAEDIISVVEELSRLGNIHLCITSRTSIIPNCKHVDVPTLSTEAARETFYHIYRRGEQSDVVDDILKQLDFHPLSVILLATAARQNKWDTGQLKKEWEGQRTGVLRARHHASLAATIGLSLGSQMFRDLGPHARDLLGVVAFFPRGVYEDNLDWLFPSIDDREEIFGGFCVLSLTHRDEGFITMLAPLRDHLCPEDPMSASLLCSVKEHYFSRLSFSIRTHHETPWIASEDVNVEHLLDVFTSIDANSESVWDACEHFTTLLWLYKPRLPVFGPKIWALPDDHPSKPGCLSELSFLCKGVGNRTEERRLLYHTLKLHRERGDSHKIAPTLLKLAAISYSPDLCQEGIQRAREAMTICQQLGDVVGVLECYTRLTSLFRCANRLDDADESEAQAVALIGALMPTADSTFRAYLQTFLTMVHWERGDAEKASSHLEAAMGAITVRGYQFPAHCYLAMACVEKGRFDDAGVHLEHAESFASSGSSEMCSLMFVRAHLLRGQGKFEEARSEALRAHDLVEGFGGEKAEEVEDFLHSIDKEMVRWESMCAQQALMADWTERRIAHAALGGDISHDEEIHQAVVKLMALLEEDGGRPGGPNFFQIRKVWDELLKALGEFRSPRHSNNKGPNESNAERVAMAMAVDQPDEMPPPEPLMRQDNGPAVIWTMDPKLEHVGQLWQALYHVPQVRHRISQYRIPRLPKSDTKVDVDPLPGGTGGHALSVHELFGHMELSGLAVVTDKSLMERLPHRPWEGISPCEDVAKAYEEFSEQVEISLNGGLATRNPNWPRLFHSRINNSASQGRSAFNGNKDLPLFSLGYDDGDGSSDLMGCLKNQVFQEFPEETPGANHTTAEGCAIMEAADVITFALERDESPQSTSTAGSQQRRKFSFPESFHLDQFVVVSRPHVQNANVAEGETIRGTGSDLARKTDIMGSMLSSLHYYENVACSPTDVERHAAIESSAAKLKNIIAHIDAEWNAIGTTVEQLKKESQNSSLSKKAQQNKYDLRAVLMHDGRQGRKHIYSYINHEDAWWKVVGYAVTKVALEAVLSDENGMDVGAGPFFLIYSRSLFEPLKSEWPETLEKRYNSNPAPSESNSLTPTEGP